MRLLERLAAETDEAEVYEVATDRLEVELKNGAPRSALARESSGVAVRALRGGRLGFAGSTDRTEHGEGRLVENLLASMALGDEVGFRFPERGAPGASPDALATWDPAVEALGPKELIELVLSVIEPLRARAPGVVFDATVSRTTARARLANSRGAVHEDRSTSVSIGVEFNRTRDQDVLLDDDGWAGPGVDGQGTRALVERIATKLDRARDDVKLERPGKLPVLFSPSGSAVVLGPILAGLSGTAVRAGTSPIRGRLGDAVLDPRLTLEDDPLRPGLLGSAPFDDEGLPRRRNVLYEGGALRTFVHDLRTAAATKQAPTASAERGGILGAPAPSFSNVVLRAGDVPLAELVAGIERGVLVESVIGMGQGNTLSGAFSNTVGLAYLIEKGAVVGRLKDVSIAANVYEALAPGGALLGLSRETEVVYGSRVAPWVLLELNVVGKGG